MSTFIDVLGYIVLGISGVIILGALISIAAFILKLLGYLLWFLLKAALAIVMLAVLSVFCWTLYLYFW